MVVDCLRCLNHGTGGEVSKEPSEFIGLLGANRHR